MWAAMIFTLITSSLPDNLEKVDFFCKEIPYGYIRNQEKNTFDVDEETAPVVVRIFNSNISLRIAYTILTYGILYVIIRVQNIVRNEVI